MNAQCQAVRFEGALPLIPQDEVPVVNRRLLDAWTNLGTAGQAAMKAEFVATFESGGIGEAKRLPWWPVLANLTIGPMIEED